MHLVVIEFYYLLACFLFFFFFKMDKKGLKTVSENKSMWTSPLSNVVGQPHRISSCKRMDMSSKASRCQEFVNLAAHQHHLGCGSLKSRSAQASLQAG